MDYNTRRPLSKDWNKFTPLDHAFLRLCDQAVLAEECLRADPKLLPKDKLPPDTLPSNVYTGSTL